MIGYVSASFFFFPRGSKILSLGGWLCHQGKMQSWSASHRQVAPVCIPNAISSRWRTFLMTTFGTMTHHCHEWSCGCVVIADDRQTRNEAVLEHQKKMEQKRVSEPPNLRPRPLVLHHNNDRQGHEDPVLEHHLGDGPGTNS